VGLRCIALKCIKTIIIASKRTDARFPLFGKENCDCQPSPDLILNVIPRVELARNEVEIQNMQMLGTAPLTRQNSFADFWVGTVVKEYEARIRPRDIS